MTWAEWRERAKTSADLRWREASKIARPTKTAAKEWLKALRTNLATLAELKILGQQEQLRVTTTKLDNLDAPDQRRIKEAGLQAKLSHIVIAQDSREPGQSLRDRALRINDGKKLLDGKLSLQCHIDETSGLASGGYVQLRGRDPARNGRLVYLRYDLDFAQMGSGPVAHFNAHWHVGDEPDGPDAEDHDPRIPSLPMDPLAVLDILIETSFPNGPADLVKE